MAFLSSIQRTTRQRENSTLLFIGLSTIFLLNPFLSVILCAASILVSKPRGNTMLYFWFAITALWLGLLNITKEPESDQLMYLIYFNRAADLNPLDGILHYAGRSEKEPIYGLLNYLCYWLLNGNARLFFIACSFIEYYILFISIYTILSHSGYGLKSVVFGVIISAFFTQFFVLSIHLLRQVMAFSIVFYAISRKAVDGKNHWLPLICAPLIHSTAALFSILSLLPWIFHRMNLRQWIYFILILMSLISSCIAIGSTLTNLLGEDNGSSYIFRRMSDGYDDGGTMDIVKSLIIIIPLWTICVIALTKRLSGSKCQNVSHTNGYYSPLYPIIHLFIFLSVMVLSFSSLPLIQYRFAFVNYSFLGFLLPILFNRKNKIQNLYILTTSIIFIIYFLSTYQLSGWTYRIDVAQILLYPAPLYFILSPL